MDSKMVLYFAHLQMPSGGAFLVARTSGDPATLAGPIVREIHTVDPGVAVYGIRKMDNILHDALARQRFASTMGWEPSLGSRCCQSLWSCDLFRCESATLTTHWVLVVMDQFTRRLIGFGVDCGTVDGVAL